MEAWKTAVSTTMNLQLSHLFMAREQSRGEPGMKTLTPLHRKQTSKIIILILVLFFKIKGHAF